MRKVYAVRSLVSFARNHHHIEGRNTDSDVFSTSKVALRMRYAHLRYYYTQFLLKNGTGTVFKPLFFEWPSDEALYTSNREASANQFLVGDALMISPALEEKKIANVQTYFPAGAWFNDMTGELTTYSQSVGITRSITSKLNEVAPVFIRGSKIVFAEYSSSASAANSDKLNNSFTMTVALKTPSSGNFEAKGCIMASSNVSDQHIY